MTANTTQKKPTRVANAAPSIIGPDVIIKGNITTQGEIQLDGTVEGDVRSALLTVGEHGSIKGVITADEVTIKGAVTGEIKSRNIRLEKTARVKGNLFHESLSVQAGAFIDGKLTHGINSEQPNETTKKPEAVPLSS